MASLFFIIPHSANAMSGLLGFVFGDIGARVLGCICFVLFGIIKLLAGLLIVIIQILIAVSCYNDFINAPAIISGWTIIRDVANMFFVIVLLIIAISTILGIETYNYKKLLPKLLLMAILINFSKMICGLLIDCSQVIMMTFVDGYKEAAAGNFATAFGLDQILTWWGGRTNITEGKENISYLEIMGALLLALVLVIVAISVTLGTILIFLIRIIMIWFLVVLSPIAYLASAFPGGAKYSQQWWTEFTKYLIVGPAMAFFLWLSLIVMSTADVNQTIKIRTDTSEPTKVIKEDVIDLGVSRELYASVSEISSSSHLLSYIIAIGMLCGSMIMAQQIGVAGAGMAMNLSKKVGKGIGMGMPAWAARKAKAGRIPGWGKYLAGIDFNPMNYVRGFKESAAITRARETMEGTAEAKKHLEAGGLHGTLLGMGATKDWAQDRLQGFLGLKGLVGKTGSEWLAKRQIKYKDKDIVAEKEKIANKITIGPAQEEIDAHLAEQRLDINTKEGKKEAEKFIIDWKFNKAQQGPTQEEIDAFLIKQNFKGTPKEKSATEWFKGNWKDERDIKDNEFENYDKLTKERGEIEYIAPQAYYARQEERHLISEERQKIDTSNDEELVALFKSAVKEGNRYKAAAVLSQAASVGHENEIINEYNFSSSAKGLNGFINEIMIKQLKMNQQSAYGLQNDVGEAAKKNYHTEFSETIGVKNGKYYQRDLNEVEAIRVIETAKSNDANVIRDRNRLGWMKQTWVDPEDHSKGKKTTMEDEMKNHMLKKWDAWGYAFERSQVNSNTIEELTDPDKAPILAQILDEIGKTTGINGERLTGPKQKQFQQFKLGIEKIIEQSKKKKSGEKTLDPAADLARARVITGDDAKYKQRVQEIQEKGAKQPEVTLSSDVVTEAEININNSAQNIKDIKIAELNYTPENLEEVIISELTKASNNLTNTLTKTFETLPDNIKTMSEKIQNKISDIKNIKDNPSQMMSSLNEAKFEVMFNEIKEAIKKRKAKDENAKRGVSGFDDSSGGD